MKQHLRLILKEIKKLDPEIDVEVIHNRGHIKLALTKGRHSRTITISCTPTNTHFVIPNVMRDVKKYFLEKIDASLQDNIH